MNKVWILTLLLSTISLFSSSQEITDIRPVEVRDGIDYYEREKGKALISRCVEAHNWKQAKEIEIIRAIYTDDWSVGNEVFHKYNNWPILIQTVRQDFVSFALGHSRVVLLNGNKAGELWGVDTNRSFVLKAGKTVLIEDQNMVTALTGKEYFIQLAYWITFVPIISYVKDTTFNGIDYSLVFGTWDKIEPNTSYDQYIYWINKDNHRLEIVNYTVRDVGPNAFGFVVFEDFRNVEGVIIPFIQKLGYLPSENGLIHVMKFESFEFNPKGVDLMTFRLHK